MIGLDFSNDENFVAKYNSLSHDQLLYLWKQPIFKDSLKKVINVNILNVVLNSISTNQYEQFFDTEIVELLLSNEFVFDLITSDKDKSDKLTSLNSFQKVLYQKKDDDIRKIMSKSIKINNNLLDIISPVIVEYNQNNNANEYRYIMTNLYNGENDEIILDQLEEDRKLLIFDMLNDKNNLDIIEIKNLVTDYLFQDNRYNVSKYINIIAIKADQNPELVDDIGYEKIMELKGYLDAMNSDNKEYIINYLNKNKDENINYLLKESLDWAKQKNKENLCNELNIVENPSDGSIGVYEYNGEEFDFVIKGMCLEAFENLELQKTMTLFDVISNEDLTNSIIYNPNIEYVYGFNDINSNNIYALSQVEELSEFGEKIIRNKLILKKDYQSMRPSFIVCYDNVSEESIKMAQVNNLPIVKINTEKYIAGDEVGYGQK